MSTVPFLAQLRSLNACLQRQEEARVALFSNWFRNIAAWNAGQMETGMQPPSTEFWARLLVPFSARSCCIWSTFSTGP